MAVPTQDQKLADWSTNFNAKIVSTPTAYGLSAALATAYTALHTTFLTARAAASVEGTRSKSLVSAKNTAKGFLLANARDLYQIVQGTPSVTNSQRDDLGITVRKTEPTPTPVPALAPGLLVVSVVAWTVRIRLKDMSETGRRGRPAGVVGASVFSYVGAAPPTAIADWKFEGNTGKTTVDVEFDDTVAGGSKVWLTAMWFNNAKESSPACAPVGTIVQGGSVAMAA